MKELVGNRVLDLDSGDVGNLIVQALEVLNVHRGQDVDLDVQQLLHILPTGWILGAGGIGVG